MIGKNNHKLFMEKGANKYKRYTLKKLSVGVVSVSIGFGLMFGSVEGVSADELTGTNSVVEPNNVDSVQSNEEVSAESNVDKSSETVQSDSSEQTATIDQSLEMKRQEVKTVLGESNIVGEQYTDLVTKIANAQTLDELEGILVEIKQTASLEDNQDLTEQSETEHDAGEKLKNHSEEKDGELDKITPPSTETSLSKESSVENLVRVDQLNVTSDVKYTLNDVRHLLNSADIARIESGELTVQQTIEKLLNNKVELRETEARHENGVLAAGVEKSSLSPDKQRGKSRSRRSLNGVDVESLFRLFTEQDTVRDVYNRIQQMRQANLIAETEFHFFRFEMLRHLRDSIANNTHDSNNLLPENIKNQSPDAEKILNMHLSNRENVTVPMSRLIEQPFRRISDETKKELDYINEFLKNIETVLLTRFGTNDEGVYFSADEYDNHAVNYASHKTRKTFHVPEIITNPDGTVTLKMSSESEGGVELKSHYAFSFNLSHELNERVKQEQLVRGLYRPDRGQQSDENGDKLQNQVSNPNYEINKYSAQNGTFPGYVGYYTSQWSDQGGYDRKKDRFAKIELTFEANDQMITDAKISSGILSNSYNYRHRPGTFIASQEFNEKAEELKTLLNLMTEYKKVKNKITVTQQKIDQFNQSLGEATRVLSQRDYDNLNTKHQNLKQEIEQIKADYTTLTNKSMYDKLHQQVKRDIATSKSGIEGSLNDLYPVNDLNNNGKKDTEDITFADQKVSDAKDKHTTLLSKIIELNGKPDISQEEYTQLINMHEEFKESIKDGRDAIDAIPQSDKISLLGETYNAKRDKLKRDLPQDNVKLPAAPTTATQTSSDPNEKNSITNPTLINGNFSDLSQGAKVGAESVNNGVNSVPGWTVINSTQEVIPLINRRKALTATVSRNEFVNPNNNNAVVLGVSSTEFVTDNLNKGKIDVDKVGGIFQTINVTPGSELVVKFRADSPGYHAGNDQGFDNKRHAVAQAQVEISDADTGTTLGTILPPSRGHGEAVGIVNIPEGVNRVKVTLSHKSARTHNISKGDLASKGWYPGAVVSDVRVSSGAHVTFELTDKSHAYTSTNSDQTPYERTLQVRFNNRGNEKAKATFTMRLPEGVTYRSVSNGTGSYDTQTRILTVTKEGIPGQGTHVTDINLTFDTSAPRTFEVETQNVTYATSPDYLPKNSNNGLGRSIQLGNVGSYSVTVAMYTSELQTMVNEYQDTIGSFKYYNAPDNLKSEYDSAIEEGRQILVNTQSTQQEINNVADKIKNAKDALQGQETNKAELEAAIKVADITTADPLYDMLQDIDSNLKSEYESAIATAQRLLTKPDATQKEVQQATDELNIKDIKVSFELYEKSIKRYDESYNQLPKLDNDQIFVTGKAHNRLTKLWSEIDMYHRSAWSKVFNKDIKQNLQSSFFKIFMKRQKLSAVPDKTEISIPAEKTSVHDLGANLSLEEKNIIKKAIEDTNNFLSGTKVEISDNGTATITFPDHTESESSQETIDRSDLIQEFTPGEKQSLLEKQKEEALSDIDSLIDLSDDERQTFKDKVAEAGTADEIVDILAEASGLSFDKLEEAKATLRNKIETLVEDEEQKDIFLEEIAAAEQLEDVQAIEDIVDAYLSVEDEDELAEAKDDAKAVVDKAANNELSPERKAAHKAAIENASNLEEITEIVKEAEQEIFRNYQAYGKDQIDKLDDANLSPEQKAKLAAEIERATTIDEIERILDKADTEASDKALTAEKEAAKAEIDDLPGLSNEAKAELKDQIDDAENSTEIADVFNEVEERALAEAKDDAKAVVDKAANNELSPERKAAHKAAIENASNLEEITEIVKEAEQEIFRNYQAYGKDQIDKLDDANLSPEQKAKLAAEIERATTIDEIERILDKADTEASDKALTAEKEAAKAEIDDLPGLSNEAKAELKDQIDDAENSTEIADVFNEVEERALAEAKDDAKAVVDKAANNELSPERKAAHKAAIENASNLEEITEIVKEAEQEIFRNYQAYGKDQIDKLDDANLSPEQKAKLAAEIERATTIDEIERILDKADTEASDKALTAEKEAAKAEIDDLPGLSNEAKAELKDQIDDAENSTEIADVFNEVEERALAEAKDDAKAVVDKAANNELSPERKAAHKAAIENASNLEEITEIVKEAEQEIFRNYQAYGKDQIDKLDDANLSPEQKAKLAAEIERATTIDEIERILDKADTEASDKALTAEKEAAKAEIDDLPGLSNEAKAELKDQIDDAENSTEIADVFNEVEERALAEAKDDAKAVVDKAANNELSPERKAAHKAAIENASNLEEITEIVKEAEQEIFRNYQAYGKDQIDKLDDANLSPEQKAKLAAEIERATTIDEIERILDKADTEASDKALTAEKEAAKAEIDDLPGLSNEAKAELKDQIDDAENSTEIADVFNEVEERALAEAKDDAKAVVDKAANNELSPERKAAHKAAIENASNLEEITEIVKEAEQEIFRNYQASDNGAGTVQPEKPEFDGGTHGLGLINEKPAFPAEELGRLLQVERDKASAYVGTLSNLDASKVTEFQQAIQQAQTVPAIEAISQTAEALNAKLAPSASESGNGAGTVQPEKPEFDGGTHGLGLINEKPAFPAEELGRLLQVERDKASAYVGTLSNLDASKVTEFQQAIQQAQTVPAIEAISQTAEALNAKLAPSASESGNGAGTVQPEKPEFDGGTHGLGLINEKPAFPAEELGRLLQVERDKASAYVGTLSNLDASKVTEFQQAIQQAQTVPAIEAISQTAEALNAKLAPFASESGNGAGTVQPEKPEFDGGTHGLGLINEKPAFPAEELGRLLQVERDKASAYVGTLSNLDASKVTEFQQAIQQAQTVPAIEAISQTAEALNAKLAPSASESGNGAGTVQPEKPEFDGGTHGLGLINEKPAFPAEELGRLLQVERDKASAYVGTLSNLDASKVTEFQKAIQNAQTVPAIEAISQTAEALNAKLASSAPESGNGEGTVQPEMPEFDGGTHGLGLINEKPTFPAEELGRLLQVERDKASAYVGTLSNLDASKVTEFQQAIQNAQTVPAIEAISQTAEALNAKLASSAPESGNGEGTVQPEMPEFNGGTQGLGLINEKPEFPAEELEQGKVGDEQEQSTEPKAPTQPGQNAPESEHPVDKPAVTDHLQKVKTQVNGQQSIQESTKQEKSGERLPDTATISWLLGVTGISTLLAGLGLKKKREDDDK
ncbi:SasC/FmtB family protein [Dolosigranulum pigrum]|uniref:SasC/FmtB family protein n=1 Tax=Dolosigranulum pigrum TaxID=29394 RepID=UPI001AD875B5|nr:SasC/FmtB family protein [Dolosigranulum pigrum]QTJ57515.1 YSIRK-type signal peptide-containing protein [Dolosigranulum pigrum]